jgi:hypothetical protein
MWGEFTQIPFALLHALDHWSKCAINAVASSVATEALYPFGGPPFLPFSTLGAKSGAGSLVATGHLDSPGIWSLACLSGRFGLHRDY